MISQKESIPSGLFSGDHHYRTDCPETLKRTLLTLTSDASAGKLPVNAAKSAGVTAIIPPAKPYTAPVGGKTPQSSPNLGDQDEHFETLVCLGGRLGTFSPESHPRAEHYHRFVTASAAPSELFSPWRVFISVCVKVFASECAHMQSRICLFSPRSTLIKLAGRQKGAPPLRYWNIQLVYLDVFHFRKQKAFGKVPQRWDHKEITRFCWYWPAWRMSLFPCFLFASNSISNAALMISWLFDEGVFYSPLLGSNSMK